MKSNKEKQLKDSCIKYLVDKGYDMEETATIIKENFKKYGCELGHKVIHDNY